MPTTSVCDTSNCKPISLTVEGLRLAGAVHYPHEKGPFPWLIMSHGLLSDKESSKYIRLAEEIAKEGIVAVRFDFRGCGRSEGTIENTTISGRLKDLQEVITFVMEREDFNGRIGLMGSSLGGYISLLQAPREPLVTAASVWATPSHLNDIEQEKTQGNLPRLGNGFYQDLKQFNLLEEIRQVKNVLVLHGDQDEMVPVEHAFRIHERLQPPKEIHILPGGDHRLTKPEDRKKATEMTVFWVKQFLMPLPKTLVGKVQKKELRKMV
jgi:dipeptidyl aminopeptidase/acylaminoacyl peptidase